MTSEADAIASIVLREFDGLPAKRKPQARENGTREWVPLSGIVARRCDGSLCCLALATGMKCLPTSKLPTAQGTVLHDWHAEVLALRAFNHFVLEECRALLASGRDSSPYLRLRTDADPAGGGDVGVDEARPFAWRDGVSLHMYCSEAPCGDASMELTMAAQADAAPWEAPLPRHRTDGGRPGAAPPPDLRLLGRACFSRLGVVRRKPARPDAPPTLSKSCSDKLALKQCTSLLGAAASLLVGPRGVYLASLVLPESQFSETACERCFSPRGRMAGVGELETRWGPGYQFRPFEVQTTGLEFAFSRRAGGDGPKTKYVASNLATAWTVRGLADNIIGGVLQGRKQTDPRGGSALCRRRLWGLARDIVRLAGADDAAAPQVDTYRDMKEGKVLENRRIVKEDLRAKALMGWVRNVGDEGFGLDI